MLLLLILLSLIITAAPLAKLLEEQTEANDGIADFHDSCDEVHDTHEGTKSNAVNDSKDNNHHAKSINEAPDPMRVACKFGCPFITKPFAGCIVIHH